MMPALQSGSAGYKPIGYGKSRDLKPNTLDWMVSESRQRGFQLLSRCLPRELSYVGDNLLAVVTIISIVAVRVWAATPISLNLRSASVVDVKPATRNMEALLKPSAGAVARTDRPRGAEVSVFYGCRKKTVEVARFTF